MSLSVKTRFEIFERDNFTCQYCGKTPPEVILHVDHIHPKSKGGLDDVINLITSCRDCNLGKKAKILKNPKRVVNIKKELEKIEEIESQMKEYYKHLKKIKNIKENNPILNLLTDVWEEEAGGNNKLTSEGKKSLQILIDKKNNPEDIMKAIRICWENGRISAENKFPYMCGILKNLSLERTNPDKAKQIKEDRQTYYVLLEYWKNQKRGAGYLPDYEVNKWLKIYKEDEIKRAMDIANGIWSDLKNILN